MGTIILLVVFFCIIAMVSQNSGTSGPNGSGGGYSAGSGSHLAGYDYDDRDHERRLDDDLPEEADFYFHGSGYDDYDRDYDYDDDPDDYDRDVDDFDDDHDDFD